MGKSSGSNKKENLLSILSDQIDPTMRKIDIFWNIEEGALNIKPCKSYNLQGFDLS